MMFLCANSIDPASSTSVADILPTGVVKTPITDLHFPDRLHTFVWRNWESVSLERMAKVLGTTPQKVSEIGQSMGLPPHIKPSPDYLQRGYISLIRRNWHLLPYEQLLMLLDWDAERLAFCLQEDDFLWIKLGNLKPTCPPLRYEPQNEAAKARCAQIKAIVSEHFADKFTQPAEPRFDFIRTISAVDKNKETIPAARPGGPVRFLYSYFGVYGDPLLNPELDPYPDGLLQRLAEVGVNGIWLHTVLRQLAPSKIFSEFGEDHQIRLANLRKLADRAKRYGINVYLYINEPRSMPESFFKGRENLKGVKTGDHYALCTSTPEVRQWLTDSLAHVFKNVPQLGGIFTITASENQTNCYSISKDAASCSLCSKRSKSDVIAEVINAIATGVWQGKPDAKVIVWDWGWPDGTKAGWGSPDWAEKIINALPEKVYFMTVSEWSKPITRGGITTEIGEYSISAVGPGPRATKHWQLAQKRGIKNVAKIQVNCTWELSAMPYLPVMNLVAEHCENLAKANVKNLMLSWTVGGCPSPNLQLVRQFNTNPAPTAEQALSAVANARYGSTATEDALAAWSEFSKAFAEYPYDGDFVYVGPAQYGPANLLYPEPTNYTATMMAFPYDDVERWHISYPAEVMASQFEKIAEGWQKGLCKFEKVVSKTANSNEQKNALEDYRIAQAACLHFKSVANQMRFTLARNALASGLKESADRKKAIATIKATATDEIQNAEQLFTLTREDSRIGFEASNHYYYFPLDMVEKVINCQYILNDWLPRQACER